MSKSDAKKQRREQERKRQRRTQRLFWGILAGFAVLVVAAIALQPKHSAPTFKPDYAALPGSGVSSAPVKIVEIGDYKCPSCQYFNQKVLPRLQKDYIDTGKVAMYFLDDPFIGPDSFTASLAAVSVFHQNKDEFWKYNDALYKYQPNEKTIWATPDYLVQLAKDAGVKVDYDRLRNDIVNKTYKDEVNGHKDFAENTVGVTGTPTLLINGVKFEDFSNYEKITAAIDRAAKE